VRCGNNLYYGRNDQDYERFCHATDVANYARADLVGGAAVRV
jgi:hypothetical protein